MTTYRDAGVDIEAGEAVLKRIRPLVRETFTPGVQADIGAFGGFFELDGSKYDCPLLVSSVDGVGTKLGIAFRANRHDTVGQDLVNHCVNDIAVCGAEPLFFLDYFSTGRLEPEVMEQVIQGFVVACKQNGCALIGGETAEMPGMYAEGEYDLAGTIVGVVEKADLVDGSRIEAGDILLGLPSTGLHTNGYSLARKVLFERFDLEDRPGALGGESIRDVLLAIHRSYLRPIRALLEAGVGRGLVHVTGGGIPGNTARVVPEGLTFEVDYDRWERPAIFSLIGELGPVSEDDLRCTFNLGIGLIAIVSPRDVDRALRLLRNLREEPVMIGDIRGLP